MNYLTTTFIEFLDVELPTVIGIESVLGLL
jgi:hypothetical protein